MEQCHSKILLIIICFLFFSCSDRNTKGKKIDINSNEGIQNIPDMEIYKYSLKHSDKNRIIWELFSEKAEVYNKEEIKKIIGVKLNFYKNNQMDTSLTSKFGEIQDTKNILTAITNVVLTTFDGTVLYTDILHWDNNRALLYTDEFVKIVKKNGDIIMGKGMEASNNLEKLIIKRNVTGKFYEKSK